MRIHLPLALTALLTATSCVVSVPVTTQQTPAPSGPSYTYGQGTRNPIIQSFTANPTNVTRGQAITFQVVAHDPGNQPLQFNWSATDGTLSTNTGQVVSWTPPSKPGVYTVMVTVANGTGGFVTGSQNLTVQPDGSATLGQPAASPDLLPSLVPSVTVSTSSAPTAAPSVLASQTPAPSLSPAASPMPTPSDGVLLSLPYAGSEAQFDTPSSELLMSNPTDGPLVSATYRSASGKLYVFTLHSINKGHPKFGMGTSTRKTSPTADTMTAEIRSSIIHGLYIAQFRSYIENGPSPDPRLATFDRVESVRMSDGAIGGVAFFNTATPLTRSNWAPSAGLPDDLKALLSASYIFKFEGPPVHLGHFDLP